MKWVVHLEGGPRRVNHAAVAVNDIIYTFGGYCTGEDYETPSPMDVHVLDTSKPYSLPKLTLDNNLVWSKLKAFSDDSSQIQL